MMAGTFSWGINNCFFIRSDLARFCRWNSTSWVESWILGFMVENKSRIIFLGALIHTIWPTCHNVCGGQLIVHKLKIWPDLVIG